MKNVDFIEVLHIRMTKDWRLMCKHIDGECANDMQCRNLKEEVPRYQGKCHTLTVGEEGNKWLALIRGENID